MRPVSIIRANEAAPRDPISVRLTSGTIPMLNMEFKNVDMTSVITIPAATPQIEEILETMKCSYTRSLLAVEIPAPMVLSILYSNAVPEIVRKEAATAAIAERPNKR